MAHPERGGSIPKDIERQLSTAQTGARSFVLEQLAIPQPEKTILLLKGLPGVGKSTVLDILTPQAQKLGARIEPGDDSLRYNRTLRENFFNQPGTILLSATPKEEQIIKEDHPEHVIKSHTIKGMDKTEMAKLLTQELRGKDPRVPIDQITPLTMGVPRLSRLLTSEPSLTKDTLLDLGASYLTTLLYSTPQEDAADLQPYLAILPPQEVLTRYDSLKDRDYFYSLQKSLEKKRFFEERYGYIEPSPEYVDRKTLEIYNDGYNSRDPRIVIFAPEIPSEIYKTIETSLGISPENPRLKRFGAADAFFGSPRGEMFSLNSGKVRISVKTPTGDNPRLSTVNEAPDINRKFTEGKLPIKPTPDGQQTTSLTLTCHDHANLLHGPITFGHMVESLLQQLEVPYLADNVLAKKTYQYDPATKKIHPEAFDLLYK